MKIFDLYSWATGSMSEFAKPFQENPSLYQKAKNFWRGMESNSLIYIIIFIIVGILVAEIYYKDFTNKPGRRYHPKYWVIFGGIAIVSSFFISITVEYLMLKTDIPGAQSTLFIIASVNALYTTIVYLLTSVFCCRFQTTNAYRLF